ncbi:hypothetical protein GEMRC1_003451 [Eukaryota sp. GEM-RC1]
MLNYYNEIQRRYSLESKAVVMCRRRLLIEYFKYLTANKDDALNHREAKVSARTLFKHHQRKRAVKILLMASSGQSILTQTNTKLLNLELDDFPHRECSSFISKRSEVLSTSSPIISLVDRSQRDEFIANSSRILPRIPDYLNKSKRSKY